MTDTWQKPVFIKYFFTSNGLILSLILNIVFDILWYVRFPACNACWAFLWDPYATPPTWSSRLCLMQDCMEGVVTQGLRSADTLMRAPPQLVVGHKQVPFLLQDTFLFDKVKHVIPTPSTTPYPGQQGVRQYRLDIRISCGHSLTTTLFLGASVI